MNEEVELVFLRRRNKELREALATLVWQLQYDYKYTREVQVAKSILSNT